MKDSVSAILSRSPLPRREAREILKAVLGIDDGRLIAHPDAPVSREDAERIESLTAKRLSGVPLAYVLERRAFYLHDFYCPQGVLIPQSDTETLVEAAISTVKTSASRNLPPFSNSELKMLDLCTGTGCIGISAAAALAPSFGKIDLTLADIDKTALRVCAINAKSILDEYSNVVFKVTQSDLFKSINEKYHLILTNPPYVETCVIPTLSPEVQAEPLIALDGGPDGLSIIREISRDAADRLLPGGWVFIETGCEQGTEVQRLLSDNSFLNIKIIKDLSGLDRVVAGRSQARRTEPGKHEEESLYTR